MMLFFWTSCPAKMLGCEVTFRAARKIDRERQVKGAPPNFLVLHWESSACIFTDLIILSTW